MDLKKQKEQRIISEVMPFARKLREEHAKTSKTDYWQQTIRYQIVRFCKGTWLLSEPVARDYADVAIIRLENETGKGVEKA